MNRDPGLFVSYAREDAAYVTRLAGHLRGSGLPVWFDDDLRVGARFTQELRQQIMRAFAVIVVMSPAAEASKWVELEILEGQVRGREFVPILLSGDRFFLLGWSKYFDARDGRLPDERVIRQLRDMCGTRTSSTVQRPSLALSASAVRSPARTTDIPDDASLQKLWTFLDEKRIEYADIFTTSLLLKAVERVDSGWMRRADGANLSFGLLADIDAAWSTFSHGEQGFRTQLSRHPGAPHGEPEGGQRDFSTLALSVGWKCSPRDTMPRYEDFVTAGSSSLGFFPTLRNPPIEQRWSWCDQWMETVMAVHLQLRQWKG
jgi:hypothetical protein